MSSFNQAIIVGNLGRDPELAHTGQGTPVLTMSVATSDRFRDSAGKVTTRTEWHRVVAWWDLAEACAKYLKKGDRALVEGRLQARKYEKDGVEHQVSEIVARRVQFLTGRRGGVVESAGAESHEAVEGDALPVDEEIPF